MCGRTRRDIEKLPETPVRALASIQDEAVLRTALVHYAFLAQACVWSEDTAPDALPASVARPLWSLSKQLGQPAILTYSQHVLDNWSLIDKQGSAELANIHMPQAFLSGQDEAWFVLIHVGIEAAAGQMLASIPRAIAAAESVDIQRLTIELETMLSVWDKMQAVYGSHAGTLRSIY